MKKLLISLIATMGLYVHAATYVHTTASFINNGTYVCFTNNVTYTNQANNAGTNLVFYSYPLGTNVLSGGTNSFGNMIPPAIVDVDVSPDGYGDVNPTYALTAIFGVYTNFPPPTFMSPVVMNTVWTNVSAQFTNNALATNVVTLTFAAISDPASGYAETAVGKTFAWQINQPGNTLPTVMSTNLPSAFLQGTRKIRLVSVTVGALSGSQGVTLDALKLAGWTP